jgi:phosphoribosylpyrophosphate synthetase
VQTGGTLYECGRALEAEGALSIAAYVAHGVFPGASWQRCVEGATHATATWREEAV